jgi:ABC transporter transmembrane region 2
VWAYYNFSAAKVGAQQANALVGKNSEEWHAIFWMFFLIGLGQWVYAQIMTVLNMLLHNHWYRWMTRWVVARYLHHKTYYDIATKVDIDNPDERIQENIEPSMTAVLSIPGMIVGPILGRVSWRCSRRLRPWWRREQLPGSGAGRVRIWFLLFVAVRTAGDAVFVGVARRGRVDLFRPGTFGCMPHLRHDRCRPESFVCRGSEDRLARACRRTAAGGRCRRVQSRRDSRAAFLMEILQRAFVFKSLRVDPLR